MIVFRGELSEEVKKFIYKVLISVNLITMTILSIIIAVPMTIAVVLDDVIWVLGYVPIPVLFLGVPQSEKNQKLAHPKEITIEENSIWIVGESFTQQRDVEAIKRIVDYGNFYQIEFYFPNRSIHCVCQKDLIVEGSIEEFEERFADYIERKTTI